jgi:hypothetical protein
MFDKLQSVVLLGKGELRMPATKLKLVGHYVILGRIIEVDWGNGGEARFRLVLTCPAVRLCDPSDLFWPTS